jgi:repressor LexA
MSYNRFVMHTIQSRLLKAASTKDVSGMSFRELGKLVGETHPQKIKHHLAQLVKKGLLKSGSLKAITNIATRSNNSAFSDIPIFGSADCGPASFLATDKVEGYLKVSSKLVKFRPGLFALRAVGNSMNKASVKDKKIENGDYVIVDSKIKNPNNNDYVVSVIDDTANIKKFVKDDRHQQIILLSESTEQFPPIYIHPTETQYMVSGKVVDVIKT